MFCITLQISLWQEVATQYPVKIGRQIIWQTLQWCQETLLMFKVQRCLNLQDRPFTAGGSCKRNIFHRPYLLKTEREREGTRNVLFPWKQGCHVLCDGFPAVNSFQFDDEDDFTLPCHNTSLTRWTPSEYCYRVKHESRGRDLEPKKELS